MPACIYSLGGCGSTLLARFLACMPGVVLLSECNPSSALLYSGDLNPHKQLRDWYPQLFDAALDSPAQDLAAPDRFGEFICDLERRAQDRGAQLVIRDYSYVDFVGVPFNWDPPRHSSLVGALKGKIETRSAVIVRRPLKQYDSLRSHRNLEHVLSPQIFLSGYSAFMKEFADAFLVRYEDVVHHPHEVVERLCAHLNIPFSADFMQRFVQYRSVTGHLDRADDPNISLSSGAGPLDAWHDEVRDDLRSEELATQLGYERLDNEQTSELGRGAVSAQSESVRMDIYAESEPLALVGPGWYRVEKSARGEDFRWVGPDASLNVARLTPEGVVVKLDVEPGPAVGLKQFRLGIFEDGARLAAMEIEGRRAVEFTLPPGEPRVHRLSLHAEDPGEPVEAPGDKRTLTFRLFKIALTTLPALGVKDESTERALKDAAMRIGQLEELLGAERRERSELERRLTREIEGRDAVIGRLESVGVQARNEIEDLSRTAQERQQKVEELQALAEERLNVIRAMHQTSETQ